MLRLSDKERQLIAEANRLKARARKEAQKERTKTNAKRERDTAYLAWLHDGIPCIACEIMGKAGRHLGANPIEAAHQYHAATGPQIGRRPPDRASCPLCAWHHRLAPNACDPAQRKFWDWLGVDVSAFCAALYDCFKADGDGAAVVRQFTQTAPRRWDGKGDEK